MSLEAESISFDLDGGNAPARLHAVAPILLGLIAPVLVLLIVDPRALGSATVILHIYLGFMFLLATAAYIVSVFDEGQLTRIEFNEIERVLEVERTGLVAKKTVQIPFSDISKIRMESRYDDDGYQSEVPLIVLHTHEVIELPATTTEADVAAMRRLIGRA